MRVVRKWVLLRLVTQIAGFESAGDSSVKSLEKVEMDWHIVAFGILREVLDGVILSHGDSSPFTTEVRALGQAIGWTGHEKIGEESVEKEWGKLRKLADAAVMES